MSESSFKLRERTAILAGESHSISQTIAVTMTEHGSDVAILSDDVKRTMRFTANLMDARQVRPHYGRAAPVEANDLNNPDSARDIISRGAELFGSIDMCIDSRLLQIPSKKISGPDRIEQIISEVQVLATETLTFLRGRKKGRVIFLMNDTPLFDSSDTELEARNQFISWMQEKAKEHRKDNITINAVGVGISEEYLLSNYPEASSITEAKKLLKEPLSEAKMVDSVEIGNIVAFLASPLSSAITGQVIVGNHGLNIL